MHRTVIGIYLFLAFLIDKSHHVFRLAKRGVDLNSD